ncbi:MAG: RagB/SusD family nutrient uptake outer membrane protein [Bacteroidota bacterium]
MRIKFICFLIVLGVISCSEDFTTKPAVGALSDESLTNETGVDLLLTGAYSVLNANRANGFGNGWGRAADNWTMDVLSDDAHKGSTDDDQADLKEIELMNWATANGYWYARWGVLFAGVNRANAVIDLISKIEEGDFSSKLAEARFLRGNFNFQIQVMWGNVPYIGEVEYAATEFNQPNSGPIWEQIEADFQFAADNLPDTQPEIGRANAWAAKAYLGKTYLHQSKWSEASSTLNDIVNNGPYSLLPEFVHNFRSEGESGPEAIFAIQFATDSGQSFNANNTGSLNFPNPGPFGSCCGFYQPTQDLANAFQTDDNGLPLLDTYNQSDIANDYGVTSAESFSLHTGNLDPRIDYTVGRRGIDYNGYGEHIGSDWIRATFADISGPYLPKKNVYWADDATNTQAAGGWGQQLSGINYNIIRFADVLLMAAEAAVETGDLGTALTNVNLVRERAKNSSKVQAVDGSGDAANYVIEPYASFPDANFARKAVRFERRLELGMEGHRLFDLRRWGVAKEVMTEYFSNEARTITNFGDKVSPYEDKHDLFPIPLNAIDLSGGVLTQNAGY